MTAFATTVPGTLTNGSLVEVSTLALFTSGDVTEVHVFLDGVAVLTDVDNVLDKDGLPMFGRTAGGSVFAW